MLSQRDSHPLPVQTCPATLRALSEGNAERRPNDH